MSILETVLDLRSSLPPPLARTSATGKPQPRRTQTTGIILHYNGPVAPARAGGSRNEILGWLRDDITPLHIQRIGADGVQYHFWVARDGSVYQVRDLDMALWHCGNLAMNNQSVAIQIPVGGHQRPTMEQWDGAMSLCDALIAHYKLPGRHVVRGHREVGASECPGAVIMPMLTQWRLHTARTTSYTMRVVSGIEFANVRTSPMIPAFGEQSNLAMIGESPVRLVPGFVVKVSPRKQGRWWHIQAPDAWGFVHDTLLVRVNDDAPLGPPQVLPLSVDVPPEDLTFVHAPRISVRQFMDILASAQSPAASAAAGMYAACAGADVDPALLLAFFRKESGYGLNGLCHTYRMNNPGNVRTPVNGTRGEQLDIPGRGKFFRFASWELGALDWAERMRDRYARDWGLRTVRAALPKYAPASDNNNPGQYASQVITWVREWQQQEMERSGHASVS